MNMRGNANIKQMKKVFFYIVPRLKKLSTSRIHAAKKKPKEISMIDLEIMIVIWCTISKGDDFKKWVMKILR